MSRIHRPRSAPEGIEPDAWPLRQCPHRPSGHVVPPVLEEQRSFGVVASTSPPGDRPPVVLSRHPVRTDYDVIEFPHALIALQLDAAQEEGYGYGYEHAMASASERLCEDGALPTATPALHNLADRHPRLFADTIRYLFGLDRDIARAVTESVRLGYALDQPLDAALNALATDSNATETAP